MIWIVAGLCVTVAILASVDDSSVLLVVDDPIQRWVEATTSVWSRTARLFSRLGSNVVVFAVFALVVAWTYRRCRS